MQEAQETKLRILASPAFKSRKVNPYTYDLYTRLVDYGAVVDQATTRRLLANPAPDIWHIHWKEELLKFSNPLKVIHRLLLFWRRLRIAKKRGIQIVWTIHNLGPHEKKHPYIEQIFWKIFLPKVDLCIHLSESGHNLAVKKFPIIKKKQSAVIPHPHYRESYENKISQVFAREKLNIEKNAFVILFIGQIRRYKNVPQLIKTFAKIEAENARLLIAGRPRERSLKKEIKSLASHDPRVILKLGFIEESDIQFYLNAANIMIAPYRNIFNSGTALLSLSFNVPIVAPRAGSLPSLEQEVGSYWIKLYDGSLSVNILSNVVYNSNNYNTVFAEPDLSAFEPELVAERTYNLFRDITRKGVEPT